MMIPEPTPPRRRRRLMVALFAVLGVAGVVAWQHHAEARRDARMVEAVSCAYLAAGDPLSVKTDELARLHGRPTLADRCADK